MSNKANWSIFEFKDFINIKDNEIDTLPIGVSISTMCASCKLGTILNIVNIEKYLEEKNYASY